MIYGCPGTDKNPFRCMYEKKYRMVFRPKNCFVCPQSGNRSYRVNSRAAAVVRLAKSGRFLDGYCPAPQKNNKCCPGINPKQHSKRYCQEAIQLARCRTSEHLSRCKGD
jgi:hypothetical protein